MPWNYHWRTSPAVSQLEQTIDQLRTENIRLRREAANKDRYIGRLKVLCHERTARIDDQRGASSSCKSATGAWMRRLNASQKW
jgi:hypothetical protein